MHRLTRSAAVGALGLLVLAAPSVAAAATPATVTKTAGAITAYAADGATAAFATSIDSATCKAPLVAVRQVSELGLGTRRVTVLKSYRGCDSASGPGLGVESTRWLAISARTAYWLDGVVGSNTYASVAAARAGIAARFSSAVVATLYATGVGPRTIGTRLGPLVAGGGAVAVTVTTTDFANSTGCNAFGNGTGGLATDCAPVVTANGVLAVSALPATSTLLASPKGALSTLLDVAGPRLLLRDAAGAVRVAAGATSIPLGSETVTAGALGTNLVVGLRRAPGGGRLTFWNGAGAHTGSCAFVTGGACRGSRSGDGSSSTRRAAGSTRSRSAPATAGPAGRVGSPPRTEEPSSTSH